MTSTFDRAALHAALGDPVRLAIVDELTSSDRAPIELRAMLRIESNLLAHHLDVLDQVGLISRHRSSGDGRRRYVHLNRDALGSLMPGPRPVLADALFVCTHNSARSQLAAVLWRHAAGVPASSAGTRPAERVHPGAVAAAARAGLDLTDVTPRSLAAVEVVPAIVVTVCDRAHEELGDRAGWLHWSIPDPVPVGSDAAFDQVRDEIAARIDDFVRSAA
ncbi:helix-turn-helix domain-containing protein [Desertimonas flava]|uniref:arsenate reductase/protein-tyrosine-phosphatase family protein n=1 Tax=Desertimonas flava TaxID=2064846 RepID=UPI0019692EE6|nr:helix-turn-helix domain-containing protein [Desertimonas flava]